MVKVLNYMYGRNSNIVFGGQVPTPLIFRVSQTIKSTREILATMLEIT
jgi:hypothetical protein